MKLYLYLLPAVLTLSCTEGSKFKGAAASATVEKTYDEPSENATPSEEVPDVEPQEDSDPVIAITKIGINFEDSVNGDNDYNDAIMCFEGGFDFSEAKKIITSTKKQTVKILTSSASDCEHQIFASVLKADGTVRKEIDYSSKDATLKLSLDFEVGDKLEVKMKPTKGCNTDLIRDMRTKEYAETLPNVCNNSGK